MSESDRTEKYLRLIVARYADAVNLGEQKSIAELKASVLPGQAGVAEWAAAHDSVRQAFESVAALETLHVSLPVSFWLSVSEMRQLGAGDAFDKARLLCAVLLAQKRPAKLCVVRLQTGGQHALVWLDETPVTVLDTVHGLYWQGDAIAEALAAYPGPHQIAQSLYEFDDQDYLEL